MPFDIPMNLDFDVVFEETKMPDHKYVVNATTGDYLGIVGSGFTCASHGDFYRSVIDTVTQELTPEEISGASAHWRTARGGAWAMLDITLPNMKATVETEQHTTEIGNRIVSLHGVDGSCSNQVFFGAIDFFCTNGCISGDWDKIRRKNTSGFSLTSFINELSRSRDDFYDQAAKMQVWANTSLRLVDVGSLLEEMIKSERKAKKMYELYMEEAATRGHNKWALYSAFTNYASYADERNGFKLRNTGKDTKAISMWSREQEVSNWTSSPYFTQLPANYKAA